MAVPAPPAWSEPYKLDVADDPVRSRRRIAGFAVSEWYVRSDVVGVHLFGELDLFTAPVLHEAFARLHAVDTDHARSTCTTVRLELSGLNFLDCAGLTALLVTITRLADLGWHVELGDPRGLVLTFLALTDALELLPQTISCPALPLRAAACRPAEGVA